MREKITNDKIINLLSKTFNEKIKKNKKRKKATLSLERKIKIQLKLLLIICISFFLKILKSNKIKRLKISGNILIKTT